MKQKRIHHPRRLTDEEWATWQRYDRKHLEEAIKERYVNKGKGGSKPKAERKTDEQVRYENSIR